MQSYKLLIEKKYLDFFEHFKIDEKTGILEKESNARFSGYPYIGSAYESTRTKILFIGLDTGVDELRNENTFHTFQSRAERISFTAKGKKSFDNVKDPLQKNHPYNAHLSGTYALAMCLLKDECGWGKYWDLISKDDRVRNYDVIRKYQKELPIDVLDRIAIVNIFKFVTIDRENRSGADNRAWLDKDFEQKFLLDEIMSLNPDIVVFQGSYRYLPGNITQELKNIRKRFIIGFHPSYWGKDKNQGGFNANSIGYIKQIAII